LEFAQSYWEKFSVKDRITAYHGKAEAILPTLSGPYDFIFFDGYAPSLKFLVHFDRLLKIDGLLVTANLFVKDPKGGKYLRALNRPHKWQTAVFADTAISLKKF
jgi:predicted O-methyltransferase YrrM